MRAAAHSLTLNRIALVPRPAWIAASIGWAGVIFALSSRPPEPGGPATFLRRLLWNGAHAPFFALLAMFVVFSLSPRRGDRLAPAISSILLGILLAGAYGLVDEWHQSFVPGRHSSVVDVATDAFGAAFGAFLMGLGGAVPGRRAAVAAACCAVGATVTATIGTVLGLSI
jgi:VanZ family protein